MQKKIIILLLITVCGIFSFIQANKQGKQTYSTCLSKATDLASLTFNGTSNGSTTKNQLVVMDWRNIIFTPNQLTDVANISVVGETSKKDLTAIKYSCKLNSLD